MDTSDFKEVFAAEARDYLQSLNENLLALETNPDDIGLLDDMFRAAHSLKGMAGTMGFSALADFTHHMENLLDRLRNGEIQVNTEVANLLFEAVDTLEAILEQTLAEEAPDDTTNLVARLSSIQDRAQGGSDGITATTTGDSDTTVHSAVPELGDRETVTSRKLVLDEFDKETLKQAKEQGLSSYRVTVTLKDNTLLKSVRVYTVFQALEELGSILKCFPSAQDLEDENFEREFSLLLTTHADADEVQSVIEGISEIESVLVAEPSQLHLTQREQGTETDGQGPTALENAGPEPSLINSQGDGDEDSNSNGLSPAADVPSPQKGGDNSSGNGSSPQKKGRFGDKFVRVETDRLDKLINLVGELVINRTQIVEMGQQFDDGDDQNTIGQLDRITTDLQYAAMKLRMVPIKQVFDRFPRMVRDIAQSREKHVQLELFGTDTELDRTIVNQIGDPLVHLLRNSVDHGIESPSERIKAGKPEVGTIRLGARHEGSHILIELSDDGQGVDVEAIRKKATAKGLLDPERSSPLQPDEAVRLLFEPGFSTAESVSDLSGRGVGMDAVKAVVESLSGTVEMHSKPGQGTRTTIKLPLTLAIIKALLVRADGTPYAIPIQVVRENLLITPEQIKTVRQKKVIMRRGEVLPLLDLAECLGWRPAEIDGAISVIVVDVRGEKIAFIVDDLIGQQEIVIKSLSDLLGDIPGIAGATVLGNGQVALILDNSTLIRQEG